MANSVFISSTSVDLRDYRAKVFHALLDAGLHPIGMENFAARPDDATSACLEEVREADLFVGIYAWRYGCVPEGSQVSITESEFNEARRIGKPCFCFVVDDSCSWPAQWRDEGPPAQALAQFKQRLDQSLVRATFTTPDDLVAKLLASLQRFAQQATRSARARPKDNEQRNLQILIGRVEQYWIDGVLASSTVTGERIALRKEILAGAIDHPWDRTDEMAQMTPRAIEPGLPIGDLFEQASRCLLLLGEAGAGKTVTLIELAQVLSHRAARDTTEPVPVIFKLTSWSNRRLPLLEWLVEEARTKYYVAGKLFDQWLRDHRIVLLLDALDEVDSGGQKACVKAINDFMADHGAAGIAVCARQSAYMALVERLKLSLAVSLKPLERNQIDAFLAQRAEAAVPLREMLGLDDNLRELASSPLMLNMMSIAYEGALRRALESSPRADASLAPAERVLREYIRRMLQRGGKDQGKAEEHVAKSLSWLATRMKEHGESAFQIEKLQPSWLRPLRMRLYYWLFSRSIVGLLLGATEGLYLGFIGWLGASFLEALGRGLATGLLFGLGTGVLSLFWCERPRRDMTAPGAIFGWTNLLRILSVFAVFVAANWLTWHSLARSGFGLVWALLIGCRMRGHSVKYDIGTADALGWSWRLALRGLGWGALVGALIGAIGSAVVAELRDSPLVMPLLVVAMALGYGLIGMIFFGLRTQSLETTVQPNQGIRLHRRNMLRGALVSGGFVGILAGGFFGGASAMYGWQAALMGIVIGLVVACYFGVLGALWYGGIDLINHYTLRWLLRFEDHAPRKLAAFLEETVALKLVQRVGGSYQFLHRLLQDYFANRPLEDPR